MFTLSLAKSPNVSASLSSALQENDFYLTVARRRWRGRSLVSFICQLLSVKWAINKEIVWKVWLGSI